MKFSKYLKLLILISIFLATSCSTTLERTNKDFVSQYGGQVDEINYKRQSALIKKEQENKAPSNFGWKNSGDIIGVSGPTTSNDAFVDTSNIKLPKPKEQQSVGLQNFERARVSPRLPKDMFKVSYNMNLYPDSYRRSEISFDDIRIPGHDAFGVETDLGKKEYLMVDNKILQENIDYLNDTRGKDDKEISLILINEQRQIKQKRILGILGEEYEEYSETAMDENEIEDNLNKNNYFKEASSKNSRVRKSVKKSPKIRN